MPHCRQVSLDVELFACVVVRSSAYESPYAPFVDVRQVAAGVSFSGAPALSSAPYVAIRRPVLWVNGSE